MITPYWLISELGYLQTHKDLQESIIRDVVRRLIKTDFNMSDTAAWQTEKLQQAGMVYSDIVSEVGKRTKKSTEDIQKIFSDAKVEVFDYGDEILEKAGYVPEEFKTLSPKMSRVLNAAFKKTTKEVRNLTMTTASTTQSLFIRSCDLAHMQIASGAFTYQDAIKNAIKNAAKESIKIIYPSGKITSLDAAVRRAVLTGTNQTAGQLQEMRADDMDVDLMEITAHSGARPEHASWQGKVVSRSGRAGYLTLEEIGYGEVKGFMGANCRHNWHLYFEGVSKSAYTPEQLEAFANEKVTYNGEELPVWEARDRQRAMERSIKSSKQLLVAYDEAGKNVFTDEERLQWKSQFNDEAVKLKGKEAKLKDFCEQTGLNRDKFREQVFSTTTENGIKGFGKSVSQKAVQSAKQRYRDFVSVVGADNAPETLDKYYDLKYNNPKEFDELRRFYKFRLDNPTSTKQHFYCVEDVKKVTKCLKAYMPAVKEIDIDGLIYDKFHVWKESNRQITEEQAKGFIRNSIITLERYNGNCWIFISKEGASYVLREENKLRTAFDAGDYKGDMEKIVEELKKHGFF